MIAGQLVHTGAPVVLWFDPPNYDAYRVNKRFGPYEDSFWEKNQTDIPLPNRYGNRPEVPEGGWTMSTLSDRIDLIVLHYDAAGLSRTCFKVLHDIRGLSTHFMVDLDGTIYQTLDVKERAWHATFANDRSVGIEIANIGAYPLSEAGTLDAWYAADAAGTRITLPSYLGDGGLRDRESVHRPTRDDPVEGMVNETRLVQYDLTDAQYESLERLTAALCVALPGIRPEAPRDESGRVIDHTLPRERYDRFSGILGHFHVQGNKVDPGPAFDWERLLEGTHVQMGLDPNAESRGP